MEIFDRKVSSMQAKLLYKENLLMRSNIFNKKYYLPWQPGFEKFSIKYSNYIVPTTDPLYEFVSDFYEINSQDFKTNTIPTIPDGCTDLMFTFDNKCIQAYVSAGVKSTQKFYFGDIKYLFGVRFMPGKTYCLFHYPIKDLVNKPMPLEDFLKNSIELKDRLSYTKNFEQRVELVRSYILVHEMYAGSKELILNACLSEIFHRNGNISINELSNKLLYSPRYLHKILTEYTGVSTKTFSEIVRQQYAILLMQCNLYMTITDIAAVCGYEDINHMNKMFKRYMGCNISNLKEKAIFMKQEIDHSICFRG